MSSAEVQQLGVLSELFAEALRTCRPQSVAVLGVAGGNGLEHIDDRVTQRVVGIDIHPDYLAAVRTRFAGRPGLELHCVNLAAQGVEIAPLDLVHAALVFEHAGVELCLENALALVGPEGALSVVLQLPSEQTQGVGVSPFASIQKLKPHFSLIDPAWLREKIEARGFRVSKESQRALVGGKSFWSVIFRRCR